MNLGAQLLCFDLLNTSISHRDVALANVHCVVPLGINGRSQKQTPGRIESTAAAEDVLVAQKDRFRFLFARGGPNEIADVIVAIGAGPVWRWFFLFVRRTMQNGDGAELI